MFHLRYGFNKQSNSRQIFSLFFQRLLFSLFQIQTDYSKQMCLRPVLSAPLELNKHLIIDGHQELFVAGECTH